MIILKVFYIFNLKKEIYDLYLNTPSVIYNFFRNIYYSKKEDLNYNSCIFKEVAEVFNKKELDLTIYIKLHNKMRYLKRNEEHIINDIFKDEISIMKIKRSYIVINSNKDNTEFFNIINEFYKECIVCDFANQKYFYLTNLKMLV